MDLERRHNLNDELYNFLLQKRAEAGISKAANKSDHVIVESARRLAAIQIAPNVSVVKNVALFLGFLTPFLFFLLFFLLNNKVTNREIIERNSVLPILGVIGHNFHKKIDIVVSAYPKSAVAEALRAIRISLGYVAPDKKNKVICITSSISGEGKSFLSSNLAVLMAKAGQKVLLIGADMRKPKTFQGIARHHKKGLSTILAGQANLKECIQDTEISNLDVILSGDSPPNPTELLGLPKVAEILNELREEYNYILIDTPPVGLVSDAMIIFDHCDIQLFVVRHNYSTVAMVRNIDEIVGHNPIIKNALIIFNDFENINKKYSYGYEYYQEKIPQRFSLKEFFSFKNVGRPFI